MRERELNMLLVNSFPELVEEFREYTSWQDGVDTGSFLVFEDLLLPRLRDALSRRDDDFLDRACSFLESLIASGDEYALNVAVVGILEGLKADGGEAIRDHLGPRSLAAFDDLGR